MVNRKRIRVLKKGKLGRGEVLYWMSRDQRAQDNWALLYAQELALEMKKPLAVCFCLQEHFLAAALRQYDFMLEGLKQTQKQLKKINVSFHLLKGAPSQVLPDFMRKRGIGALVADFSPLKVSHQWRAKAISGISIPFFEVDAHNIVPCWLASPKKEFGAYTFRPKINSLLPEFMEEFPKLKKHPFGSAQSMLFVWNGIWKYLKIADKPGRLEWIKPGSEEALKALRVFLKNGLSRYSRERNDPNADAQSNLSPFLHFGQISAQRVALEVEKSGAGLENKKAFLEELIVRRELSDNFCFYDSNYDSFKGFPLWAQKTMNEHRKDKKIYLYSLKNLEQARTHDPLWNAAQTEMVKRGKMHGYLRMYWAKKILEWSSRPEEALKNAIYLNDRYELDGRDPNGYAGIAWSVGGVHDRAWGERAIFGKVRYMSFEGMKRKIDVSAYIEKIGRLS